MDLSTVLDLVQTALELGLCTSLTVLALFLSYSMLNVCDLSTDGCFTLGAAVGAMVAVSGHPYLSIFAAMAAGIISGFVTAFLQTKMGIDSLLAGIIVNTGLYSINMAVMGNSSLVNMNTTETIYTVVKNALKGTPFASYYKLIVIGAAVLLVIVFLSLFLRTRLGLAIRATGNNPDMVRSSSIKGPRRLLLFGGSVRAVPRQSQKSVSIDVGSGMVTVALASLLIGRAFFGRGKIPLRAVGVVIGSVVFRLVYTIALRFNIPAYMLKLVSSVIVIIAISGPYLRRQLPIVIKRIRAGRGEA